MTTYEVAIPIAQLAPFAPDTWPKCGIDVVINDSDGKDGRKGRLELVPGAMTNGKHPAQFAVMECVPSASTNRVSAGLVWERRCMQEGGAAELTIGMKSPKAQEAVISARLTSLDSPGTRPQVREIRVPVTASAAEFRLKVKSTSPPGRYRLGVSVRSASGDVAASDALNVYIYPAAHSARQTRSGTSVSRDKSPG